MQEADLDGRIKSFNDLPDPRSERNQDHPLLSVVVVAICGAICGADNCVDIEAYGRAKHEWLSSWLDLPNGIPSHDTFGRVFRFLNPQAFQERFMNWISQVGPVKAGEVSAIDGKQMRGAQDVPSGKEGLYMVSAWAVEAGIVLGQSKVDEKSNEITAIPELLAVMRVGGWRWFNDSVVLITVGSQMNFCVSGQPVGFAHR